MSNSPTRTLSILVVSSMLILLFAVIGIPALNIGDLHVNTFTNKKALPYDLRINDDVILKCFNNSGENVELDLELKNSSDTVKTSSLQLVANGYTSENICSLFNLKRKGNKKDVGTISFNQATTDESTNQVSCELINIKYDKYGNTSHTYNMSRSDIAELDSHFISVPFIRSNPVSSKLYIYNLTDSPLDLMLTAYSDTGKLIYQKELIDITNVKSLKLKANLHRTYSIIPISDKALYSAFILSEHKKNTDELAYTIQKASHIFKNSSPIKADGYLALANTTNIEAKFSYQIYAEGELKYSGSQRIPANFQRIFDLKKYTKKFNDAELVLNSLCEMGTCEIIANTFDTTNTHHAQPVNDEKITVGTSLTADITKKKTFVTLFNASNNENTVLLKIVRADSIVDNKLTLAPNSSKKFAISDYLSSDEGQLFIDATQPLSALLETKFGNTRFNQFASVLKNNGEISYQTNPAEALPIEAFLYNDKKDSDQDGVRNDEEKALNLDPKNPDSNNDGIIDGEDVFGVILTASYLNLGQEAEAPIEAAETQDVQESEDKLTQDEESPGAVLNCDALSKWCVNVKAGNNNTYELIVECDGNCTIDESFFDHQEKISETLSEIIQNPSEYPSQQPTRISGLQYFKQKVCQALIKSPALYKELSDHKNVAVNIDAGNGNQRIQKIKVKGNCTLINQRETSSHTESVQTTTSSFYSPTPEKTLQMGDPCNNDDDCKQTKIELELVKKEGKYKEVTLKCIRKMCTTTCKTVYCPPHHYCDTGKICVHE